VLENQVEKTVHVLDEVRLAVLQTEIFCAEKFTWQQNTSKHNKDTNG